MPIESASFISQLDAANPLGTEPKSTADDHLRLIKTVLKTQFPNFGAVALSATATAINQLTTAAVADSSGNVSIGTSSPLSKFHVEGADPIQTLRSLSVSTNFFGHHLRAGPDILSSWLLNSTTGQVSYTAGYVGFGGFFTWTTNGVLRNTLDSNGNFITTAQAAPPALTTNGQMVANLTSNTNLRISVRGSDGVTRTANLTLA